MAKKDKNQNENGFFAKIKNFFRSLNSEIKKVIWPDKPTVAKTTATVIVIVLLVTLLVFIVDSLMVSLLGLLGFNTAQSNQTLPSSSTSVVEQHDNKESEKTTTTTTEAKETTSESKNS